MIAPVPRASANLASSLALCGQPAAEGSRGPHETGDDHIETDCTALEEPCPHLRDVSGAFRPRRRLGRIHPPRMFHRPQALTVPFLGTVVAVR